MYYDYNYRLVWNLTLLAIFAKIWQRRCKLAQSLQALRGIVILTGV